MDQDQIGLSVWVRQFFTAEVARDLYGGVPAIYVNYLDYDVAAHAFGPEDRAAFRSLEFVDRAIHQIGRVLRRVPEHQYDLFILADHGQAGSIPFADLTGGSHSSACSSMSSSILPLWNDRRRRRADQLGLPTASWPTESGGRGWAGARCISSIGSSREPSTSGKRTSGTAFG